MLLVSYNVDSSLPKIIQPRMSMVARLRNCFRKKEPSRVSQSPIESGRIWGLGLDTLLLIQRGLYGMKRLKKASGRGWDLSLP